MGMIAGVKVSHSGRMWGDSFWFTVYSFYEDFVVREVFFSFSSYFRSDKP